MDEEVNSPAHYGGEDSPLEHVKVAVALEWHRNAFLYNATKYLWRLGRKKRAAVIPDMKKARWYLDKAIEQEEAKTR